MNKKSIFNGIALSALTIVLTVGPLAQQALADSPREALANASGGFLMPARPIQTKDELSHYFDPYQAFNVRYRALAGVEYPRSTYDSVNAQEPTDVTCNQDFPHSPQLKEISMIVMVVGDDYTGRTFLCLIEHHLKKGTRVRVMVGGLQTDKPIFGKLDKLAKEYPNFHYRVHNGTPYSLIGKINLAIHVKSFLTVGADPKDSILITGGRNLSDRYYFPNFPHINNPFALEEKHVFYTDLEIAVRDPKVVADAEKNHLAIWHRLPSNYNWDTRVPLETQMKLLDATQPITNFRHLEKKMPGYKNVVEEEMYVLRPLTETRISGARISHWLGVQYIPQLQRALESVLSQGFDLMEIYKIAGQMNFQQPEDGVSKLGRELKDQEDLMTRFRKQLYQKMHETMLSTGLYQRAMSKALAAGYPKKDIPPFEEWYANFFDSIDRMIFAKNLDMLSDFETLFANNFKDTQNLSAPQIQKIVEKGFGPYWDRKDKKIENVNVDVLQFKGLNDYVFDSYYNHQGQEVPTAPSFVRHVFSHAAQDGRFFERTLVQLINSAQNTIRIVNCFYHPTKSIREALNQAAARGVKVYITTNTALTKDDLVTIPEQANRKSINAQVKIENITFYDFEGFILHPKLYVFDEEVSYIGSVNMNKRTMRYNNESGVFVADKAFTQELIESLWNTQFTEADPQQQPFGKSKLINKLVKSHGFFARMMVYLLGHLM